MPIAHNSAECRFGDSSHCVPETRHVTWSAAVNKKEPSSRPPAAPAAPANSRQNNATDDIELDDISHILGALGVPDTGSRDLEAGTDPPPKFGLRTLGNIFILGIGGVILGLMLVWIFGGDYISDWWSSRKGKGRWAVVLSFVLFIVILVVVLLLKGLPGWVRALIIVSVAVLLAAAAVMESCLDHR